MSRKIGEREEPLVKYNHRLKKRKSSMMGFMNLVLLLIGVYVALFVESFAKYVLLLALFAVYFFAKIE